MPNRFVLPRVLSRRCSLRSKDQLRRVATLWQRVATYHGKILHIALTCVELYAMIILRCRCVEVMKMKITENVLHYYINLLRTRDIEERNRSETDSCVNALYNAIRTMKHSRKSMVCGEDLSYLDFGYIPLNEIYWNKPEASPTIFRNSFMSEVNFRSGHCRRIWNAVFNHSNEMLMSSGQENSVILWDIGSGLAKHRWMFDRKINSLHFSPDDSLCLIATEDKIYIFDSHTYENKAVLDLMDPSDKSIISKLYLGESDIRFSINGDLLSIDRYGSLLKVWNLKKPKDRYRNICLYPTPLPGSVKIVNRQNAFTNTMNKFFIVLSSGYIAFYDHDSKMTWYNDEFEVELGKIAPNGMFCLIADHNCAAIVDAETGSIKHNLIEQELWIKQIDISPDSIYCLTLYEDNTIDIWHSSNGQHIKNINSLSTYSIKQVFFVSVDNSIQLLIYTDTTIMTYDFSNDRILNHIAYNSDVELSAVLHNNNFCCFPLNSTLVIWNLKDGRVEKLLKGYMPYISSLAISSNQEYAIIGLESGNVSIWDLQEKKIVKEYTFSYSPVMGISISNNGKMQGICYPEYMVSSLDFFGNYKIIPIEKRGIGVINSNSHIYFETGNYNKESHAYTNVEIVDSTSNEPVLRFNTDSVFPIDHFIERITLISKPMNKIACSNGKVLINQDYHTITLFDLVDKKKRVYHIGEENVITIGECIVNLAFTNENSFYILKNNNLSIWNINDDTKPYALYSFNFDKSNKRKADIGCGAYCSQTKTILYAEREIALNAFLFDCESLKEIAELHPLSHAHIIGCDFNGVITDDFTKKIINQNGGLI